MKTKMHLHPTDDGTSREGQTTTASSSCGGGGDGGPHDATHEAEDDKEEEERERELDRNPLYVELHRAVRSNDEGAAASIVRQLTNVNVPSLPDYQSPAHVAASLGHSKIVELLATHRYVVTVGAQ